jgi:methyl-accepting chemotaxis protein
MASASRTVQQSATELSQLAERLAVLVSRFRI